MKITNEIIYVDTEQNIGIYNITSKIQEILTTTKIKTGQVVVFSRHTTTAIIINEDEERLLEDIKAYLKKLAPPTDRYLHNDLHLRIVPPDESINTHSHLMAMTLSTSETIPIIDGKLALGTWQSVLFVELDGPRTRTLSLQFWGE